MEQLFYTLPVTKNLSVAEATFLSYKNKGLSSLDQVLKYLMINDKFINTKF